MENEIKIVYHEDMLTRMIPNIPEFLAHSNKPKAN
jgi:hypothetical protein